MLKTTAIALPVGNMGDDLGDHLGATG